MPENWHFPWGIPHGKCQFLGITWETGRRAERPPGEGPAGQPSSRTTVSATQAGFDSPSISIV